MPMYFPTHLERYVTTSHFTSPWLQKVLTSYRCMARKLSCMRAKDVQVPPPGSHQGRQTRTSQRAAIERPESSRARFGDGPLRIQSPYVVYVLCRVRPNAHDEVQDEMCEDMPMIAPTSIVPISN